KCRFPVKCQNQHLIRRTLTTMQGVRNLAHHGGGFSGSRRSHQQLARRRCHRGHPLLVRQRGPLDGIKQGRILLEGAGKFVVRHACAITGCKGIRLTSCTNKQNWIRTSTWAGKPCPLCCYTLYGPNGLSVFTDLVTHDAANRGTTHGAQDTTACDYGAGNPTHTCARDGAFLTMAHAVPRGTAHHG